MKNARLIASLVLVMTSSAALATDNVSSPNVEQGRLGLEYRGGYDIDDDASKDRRQAHKLVVNYGLSERLRAEVKAVIADAPNDAPDLDAGEFGLRYQFLEKDEAWAAAALDGNYTIANDADDADTFEARVLVARDFGALANIANIGFESEVGDNAEDGLAFKFGWKSSYAINPHFAPGFEYYLDTGNLDDDPDFDDQTHKIGPVVTGKITDSLKYDAGYLFGLSDNAPDGRIKVILSYSKNF